LGFVIAAKAAIGWK